MSQALVINAVRSRHVVVTWFGNCSYRKLHVTYEVRKMLCPLCKNELVDGEYFGRFLFEKNLSSPFYVRDCWLPMDEGIGQVWKVKGAKNESLNGEW